MRRKTMRLGAVAIATAAALLGAGTALGDTFYVYEGQDFGYIGHDHKYAGVCDREYDGFNVYVNFKRTTPNTVVRMEEANGYCKTSTTGTYAIHTLQTCENRPLMTDACSAWQRHP
ncbi:hypothetical protein [Streptomyces lavendulocolor]|uniref:hypothetical protein n=1 Tax=Streptomyces lavendulocolor TaxID=67316 RepID=UPI0031D543BA